MIRVNKQINAKEYRACILCNSKKQHKSLFTINESGHLYLVSKCKTCGMIFISSKLSRKNISDFYNKDKNNKQRYLSYYSDSKINQNKTLKILSGHQQMIKVLKYKSKGSILEVGSASGFVLDAARELGFETFGVEICKDLAKEASAKGHIIHVGTIDDFYPKKQFDVIISVNTVEHFLNPLNSLKKLHDLLKPNGICIVSVPNHLKNDLLKCGYAKSFVRDHLSYFTPKTLRLMVRKAGFKIIDLRTNFLVHIGTKFLKFFRSEKKSRCLLYESK